MSRLRSAIIAVVVVGASTVGVAGANRLSGSDTAQAAVPASAAPSLFVPIDAYRTMDTRLEQPVGKMGLTFGRPLPRNVAYVVTGGESPVPNSATAVTFNITLTETEGAGFAQIDRFRTADGSTSTINWTGDGQTVANSGVVQVEPLDTPQPEFGLYVGGAAGAEAHIIIDITGYYIAADVG